jgi:hypothetical protein
VAAKAQIEVRSAPSRRAGKCIHVVGAANASVRRAVGADGRIGSSAIAGSSAGNIFVGAAVVAIGAFNDGARAEAINTKLRNKVRRRVPTGPPNRVKGTVRGLEFDSLVARRGAAGQSAHTDNHGIAVAMAAQANGVLPRARLSISRRRIIDDVLDNGSAQIDAAHSLCTVSFLNPMRIMTIDALYMFGVGESRIGRGLARA